MILRGGAVALLLLLLAAPSAAAIDAQVRDAVRGSGEGRILGGLDRANIELTEFTKPQDILFARRLVVTEYRAESTETAKGLPRYSHESHKAVAAWTYQDATLMLLRPGDGANLVIVDNGTVESTLATTSTFRLAPPGTLDAGTGSVNNDPYDPKGRFERREAASVHLSQEYPDLALRGDFTIRVGEMTFCIEERGVHTEHKAWNQRFDTAAASLRNETFFVVDVFGGELRLGVYARRIAMYTPDAAIDLDGTLELLGSDPVTLRGLVHADADAFTPNEFRLSYHATDRLVAESIAPMPDERSTLPWIGTLAFGAVALGSGAWAVRSHRRAHPARLAAAPKPEASAAKPGLAASESAYAKDPGNITLGLDLGLSYLKAGRVQDALPLLLMATQAYPKAEVARYSAGLALLEVGRVQEAVDQLHYAFRLNPLNVARFLKEGPAASHGKHPLVRDLLGRWARVFHDAHHRGYA